MILLFQKEITKASKLSYCDYLIEQNNPAAGMAKVLISHAWKHEFLDVMDALEKHFLSNPT